MTHLVAAYLYAGIVWGILIGCSCVLAIKMYRYSILPRGGKRLTDDELDVLDVAEKTVL